MSSLEPRIKQLQGTRMDRPRGKRGKKDKPMIPTSPAASASSVARSYTTPPPQRTAGGGSSGRNNKGGVDASFLLNFRSPDRRADPPPTLPARRRGPIVRFNKERFIQANFRFVVEDGDYCVHLAVPDKMVDWESIREVHVSASSAYDCPICLSEPVSARVTKCGHVYCWPCLMRLFSVVGKPYGPCPICTDTITRSPGSLKPAVVHKVAAIGVKDSVSFQLMKRERGTGMTTRVGDGDDFRASHVHGCPDHAHADVAFNKISIVRDPKVISAREREELTEALELAISSGEQDLVPHIQACLRELDTQDAGEIAVLAESTMDVEKMKSPTAAMGSPLASPTAARSMPSASHPKYVTQTSKTRCWVGGEMHDLHDDDVSHDEGHEDALEGHEDIHEGHEDLHEDQYPMSPPQGERGFSTVSDLSQFIDAHDFEPMGYAHADLLSSSPGGAGAEGTHKKKVVEAVDGWFFFYQALHGARVYLHPLSMRCLLEEHDGYLKLPRSIKGKVVDLERHVQTEELRKRYRPLEHLPLSCEFSLAELDMAPLVCKETLRVFAGKFKERADARKQRERREAAIRARAERVEKRARDARNAPPPSDLFSGPSLAESMAAAQAALDEDELERMLASDALSPPLPSLLAVSPPSGQLGAAAGPSWRDTLRSPGRSPPKDEAFPVLGEESFPSLGPAAAPRAAAGTSPGSHGTWGKKAGGAHAQHAHAPHRKPVVDKGELRGGGDCGCMFGMDDLEDEEEVSEEERNRRMQLARDKAWEAAFQAAQSAEGQQPAASGGGKKSGRKNKTVLLSW